MRRRSSSGGQPPAFTRLGYTLHPIRRLRPSAESVRRLKERTRRLYEQGASTTRLWQYVTRWCNYQWGGVYGRVSRKGGVRRYWVWILTCLNISDLDTSWFNLSGYRPALSNLRLSIIKERVFRHAVCVNCRSFANTSCTRLAYTDSRDRHYPPWHHCTSPCILPKRALLGSCVPISLIVALSMFLLGSLPLFLPPFFLSPISELPSLR